MGDRRCCCTGDCYLLTDDFDDAESTTLSSDWNEVSGVWSYDGEGLLVEAGTDESAVLTTASSSTTEQSVGATAPTFSTGDKFRLIANAKDDDNYLFMEVEVGAASYFVRLCSRVGGAESVLSEDEFEDVLNPSSPLGLDICLSSRIFVGTVTNDPVTAAEGNRCYVCNPTLISGGKHAGLGNGGTSEITWEGFNFGDLVTSDPEQQVAAGQCRSNQCCIMPCTCCGDDGKEICIPKQLLLTISAGGGCLPLDGVSVVLTYNPGTGNWEAAQNSIPCFGNAFYVMSCNQDACLPGPPPPIGSFGLYIYDPGGGCLMDVCIQGSFGEWENSYTCDPFEVNYTGTGYEGGFVGSPCYCCDPEESGTVSYKITELA